MKQDVKQVKNNFRVVLEMHSSPNMILIYISSLEPPLHFQWELTFNNGICTKKLAHKIIFYILLYSTQK